MELSRITLPEIPVVTINDRVSKVIRIAQEHRIYTVPVVDSNGRLVGLVTYRELLERRVSPMSKVKSVLEKPHKISEGDPIEEVARRFYSVKLKQLPVVDRNAKVIALAHRDLVAKYLIEEGLVPNEAVEHYCTKNVITCSPDDLVAKARWEMLRNVITRLPVVSDGKLVGIITMRDIIEKLYYAYIAERPSIGGFTCEEEILAAPVKAIMTSQVITAKPSETVLDVLNKMLKHRVSGLPVVDEESRVVGIVTSYDIIRAYLARKFTEVIPVRAHVEAELDSAVHKYIEKVLSNYYSKLSRIVDIIDFKVHVKVYECSSDENEKRCKYSVHVYIKHEYGSNKVNIVDWDVGKAVRDALHLLYRNVLKQVSKLRTRGRRAAA